MSGASPGDVRRGAALPALRHSGAPARLRVVCCRESAIRLLCSRDRDARSGEAHSRPRQRGKPPDGESRRTLEHGNDENRERPAARGHRRGQTSEGVIEQDLLTRSIDATVDAIGSGSDQGQGGHRVRRSEAFQPSSRCGSSSKRSRRQAGALASRSPGDVGEGADRKESDSDRPRRTI